MYARKAKLAVLLMSAAMVSCSQHEEFLLEGEADGTEIITSVTLTTPEVFGASRSVPEGVYTPAGEGTTPITLYPGRSGMSSFGGVAVAGGAPVSNVDLNEHPLTYTVGVYVATTTGEGDAATTIYSLIYKQALVKHADSKATFNFSLIKGRPYRIVAYADYAEAEKENLETIPVTFGLNDELKDAFFASQDFVASEQLNVVLRRPFGKLRLMAGDFNTFNYSLGVGYKINKIKVTYKTPYMLGSQNFNAVTGMFDQEAKATTDVEVEANPVAYAMEYDAEGRTDTAAVFTMYLPANFTNTNATEHGTLPAGSTQYIEGGEIPDSWMYPFDVTVDYEETGASGAKNLEHNRSFAVDIPVKRNWLTTVYVNEFWAENSTITVSIDHRFQGEIDYEYDGAIVKTANGLQAEIDKICANYTNNDWFTGKIYNIKLGADINADENTTIAQPGGFVIDTKCVRISLDLNGHKIYAGGNNVPKYAKEGWESVGGAPVGGVIGVRHQQNELHIYDSKKYGSNEHVTGMITHKKGENEYPLIYCKDGGQVFIDGGVYKSECTNTPAVYVYETESHHALMQYYSYVYAKIKQKKDLQEGESNDPTGDPNTMAKITKRLEDLSAKVVINDGWFENAQSVTDPNDKICINAYNAKRYADKNNPDPKTCWEGYKDFCVKYYGDWTSWGEFPSDFVTFGYVYLNGGSYVNFNPAKGDNKAPGAESDKSWHWGMMDGWVDDSKFTVHSSVVNGKPVYTVLPKTTPGQETPYNYPIF